MSSIPRPPAHRIVFVQFGLVLLAAGIGLIFGVTAAKSALLGGLACALPNAYFIWRAFRYTGARSAQKMVQSIYQGQAWKFILTATMFAVILVRVDDLNALALFGGFITVQMGHVASMRLTDF
ncbi:MAG: ATP synthase subunit I [Bacterioplanes sp.]|nr:ATP synthase subunit I [Bacterioplanes sp.]